VRRKDRFLASMGDFAEARRLVSFAATPLPAAQRAPLSAGVRSPAKQRRKHPEVPQPLRVTPPLGKSFISNRSLLAHLGDLYDWALSIASGNQVWRDAQPLPWDEEVKRFFAVLEKFDDYLASGKELHESAAALLQGPIADSLTHIGQIAMLRRIAGCSIKAENYHKAEIVAGRVGAEQAAPRREF
jgi:hypothetical protein